MSNKDKLIIYSWIAVTHVLYKIVEDKKLFKMIFERYVLKGIDKEEE